MGLSVLSPRTFPPFLVSTSSPSPATMSELKRLLSQVDHKLREPGLISSVAAAVEDNTGLPRMVLVYVLVALTGLWLVFGYGAGLLCNSLAFVYPAYMSIKAIESTNKGDDTQWLTYWTVFSTFSVMEFFSDILVGWVPFYWLSKCIFMVWCMAPIQSNGSMIVYNNLILPFFIKHEKEITAIFTEATETVGEIASEVFNDASGTVGGIVESATEKVKDVLAEQHLNKNKDQ